ncbi:MAG: hypothetical protein ACUVV6_09610 [Thermoplasmatota archaeon]
MGERDLRVELIARLGPERLGSRLEALREESGGLLSEEALIALIADEEGMCDSALSTIEELRPDRPVNIRCRVESIEPTREFIGKSGPGRVRRLIVSDRTGRLALTLWDEDTEAVGRLGIAPGSRIRILSAAYREGRFGPEIQLGRGGFMLLEAPEPAEVPSVPANIDKLAGLRGRVTVRGVLLSMSSSGRGRGRIVTARIFDGTGECLVELSGMSPDALEGLAAGQEVELTGALVMSAGGAPALRCDGGTRIRRV